MELISMGFALCRRPPTDDMTIAIMMIWWKCCLDHEHGFYEELIWDFLRTIVFVPMVSLCFLLIFDDFWCREATSAAWEAPLGTLVAPMVDFGAIWVVIWEAFGVNGRLYEAISEPWMPSIGVFLVQFILDIVSVANSCQNCLEIVRPRPA